MSLIKWQPGFEPISPGIFNDIEKFFDNAGFGFRGWGAFVPAIDVYQTKDDITVETPLPGVDPEDVSISIENDVLTIEGKSEKKSEVDEKDYFRKEVRLGSFHRAVALPVAVNGDEAKASYENGVLKIVIPKEERAKPKSIKVEVKGK